MNIKIGKSLRLVITHDYYDFVGKDLSIRIYNSEPIKINKAMTCIHDHKDWFVIESHRIIIMAGFDGDGIQIIESLTTQESNFLVDLLNHNNIIYSEW